MDNLKGPTLDYAGVFDEFTGQTAGLNVWQIDNFYPVLQDEALHGKFYTGDCYIVLDTQFSPSRELLHQIYFWIGDESSLDKKVSRNIFINFSVKNAEKRLFLLNKYF